MLPDRVHEGLADLPDDFVPQSSLRLPAARGVLMVAPDAFDVVYDINPHMRDADGALRQIDPARARAGWDALRRTYESLGYPVSVLPAAADLPDMVFAANQALPFPGRDGEGPGVLLSSMRHPERRPEVEQFRQWFAGRAEVLELSRPDLCLEGHGDLLWFPGRRLLFGGHGFRTDRAALDEVAERLAAPVLALELRDPRFYHLDTCLCPLAPGRALWVPDAFDEAGRALLQKLFADLHAPTEDEAGLLACNAHCPDGRNVLIEAGCRTTAAALEERGFRVHPVDTGEFLKAGGSVFCLKTMLPSGCGA